MYSVMIVDTLNVDRYIAKYILHVKMIIINKIIFYLAQFGELENSIFT